MQVWQHVLVDAPRSRACEVVEQGCQQLGWQRPSVTTRLQGLADPLAPPGALGLQQCVPLQGGERQWWSLAEQTGKTALMALA